VITVTVGKPGAGKSIIALEFHILPALLDGRTVYHNIPGLNPVRIANYLRSIQTPKNLGITAFKINSQLRDFSYPREPGTEWADESEEEWGKYYLSEIPKAPLLSLIILDEAQKKCYINAKDSKEDKNIKFAEYCSLHRKGKHELHIITQVMDNVDDAVTSLRSELIYLHRKDNLGIFGRNKVREKHYEETQTLRQKPLGVLTRKYNSAMFDLYQSYTVEGGKEIRKTATIFTSPPLTVLIFFIGIIGLLIFVPKSCASLSPPQEIPKTAETYLGSFEDYNCGDKLYVLRKDGKVDTLATAGVPLYVCPKRNYTHSMHSKQQRIK
jgi:zona occludens toxin (predicted ATPase)